MQIKVKFIDGRIELVRPRELQNLIDARRITQFRRSGGWVAIGQDSVRSTLRGVYSGPERRDNFEN
ncbi:GSU3473 family protein [Geopsychrobacter electrodiphilus]|uniref:GSU3473 family protein n=1 Tax=Geopsychrobacter electrodiphilus TaxID=225196 RepID=UPI003CCC1A33